LGSGERLATAAIVGCDEERQEDKEALDVLVILIASDTLREKIASSFTS